VHKHMLDGGLRRYLIQYAQYAWVTILVGLGSYMLLVQINGDGIIMLLGKALLCTLIANGAFALLYRKNENFADLLQLAKRLIKK